MTNNIYNIFAEKFTSNQFIRLGDNKNICLYLGKNESNLYSLEFRGKYVPNKISSSEVILVKQTKNEDSTYSLVFSLCKNDLLEYFCIFCEDLFDSTKDVDSDEDAYTLLCDRYFSWKKLFRPHSSSMTDSEIMGLIGELLFIDEFSLHKYGPQKALESWSGPEKTHKDFSLDDTWYEIKSITSGKPSVKISSLEQLDSDIDGYLVVYELEKMSSSFNGVKLNQVVQKLLNKFGSVSTDYKDKFITKLSLYNYDFSNNYDEYVFYVTDRKVFSVKEGFPRIKRKDLPIEICNLQYELSLQTLTKYQSQDLAL